MRVFAENYKKTKGKEKYECPNVEIECSKRELDKLIDLLIDFQKEINTYIETNQKCEHSITHFHYQDNNDVWSEDDADIVVYVKM
jgi:hypothetical protein